MIYKKAPDVEGSPKYERNLTVDLVLSSLLDGVWKK